MLRIVSTLAAQANTAGYYTPAELATAAGASLAAVTALWCGAPRSIAEADLIAICRHLECQPGAFLHVHSPNLDSVLIKEG